MISIFETRLFRVWLAGHVIYTSTGVSEVAAETSSSVLRVDTLTLANWQMQNLANISDDYHIVGMKRAWEQLKPLSPHSLSSW